MRKPNDPMALVDIYKAGIPMNPSLREFCTEVVRLMDENAELNKQIESLRLQNELLQAEIADKPKAKEKKKDEDDEWMS